jgi:ABC-type multidrug transport system fused ATPase/permease subunit
MVGLMFWIDWDFTLIAVVFTPFLLVFVFHFKKAVKEATRAVRARQSDVLSIVQRGLGSIRVTKAFGRQDLEMAHLEAASNATVAAALRARQIKSLMSHRLHRPPGCCWRQPAWRGGRWALRQRLRLSPRSGLLLAQQPAHLPVSECATRHRAQGCLDGGSRHGNRQKGDERCNLTQQIRCAGSFCPQLR